MPPDLVLSIFFVPLFVPLLSQLKQKESRKNQSQVEQIAKTKGANQLNLPANPLISMVLQRGFEPPAPGLGILCSIHLSYWSNAML
jgi:hypothetical protein